MKLTLLGIGFIVVSIAVAGNWLYSPISIQKLESFEPIPHYPEDDPADQVFHSELTYIPSEDIFYQEYNYVWLNQTGHTPDTEEVRIYIKNNTLHHVELRIHYQWMKITEFTSEGNHLNIYFSPLYHTPYTKEKTLVETNIMRAIPIAIPLLIGISLILYENKEKISWKI